MSAVLHSADEIEAIRKRLDELGQRQVELDRAQDELTDDMAEAIAQARAAGLSGFEVARRTRLTRSWLYRRFRKQDEPGRLIPAQRSTLLVTPSERRLSSG